MEFDYYKKNVDEIIADVKNGGSVELGIFRILTFILLLLMEWRFHKE